MWKCGHCWMRWAAVGNDKGAGRFRYVLALSSNLKMPEKCRARRCSKKPSAGRRRPVQALSHS
eukprot:3373842-Alexandrium_andersonii.AAC.1